LIIIGGGTAGLIAAGLAVPLGVRVALVEQDRIGGDCTWTGCVPSKTLLKTAKVAHQMPTTVGGEIIHGCIVAIERGLEVGHPTSAIHVRPTCSTASMQVAAHIRVSQLLSGTPGRIVRRLARLMR
jgi:NADH dehydrogenase FAD-containing subunit